MRKKIYATPTTIEAVIKPYILQFKHVTALKTKNIEWVLINFVE